MKVQAEWRMWRAEGCFAAITVVPGWIVNACFWCEIGHWSDAQQACRNVLHGNYWDQIRLGS